MDVRTPLFHTGLSMGIRSTFSSVLALMKKSDATLPSHLRLGREGEELAAKYLREEGFVILAKNVRVERDEIDLIAQDRKDDVLVFVEVKTRASESGDFPAELNAGERKWKKLRRAARRWVSEHEYEGGYRMDLICICGGRVTNHVREVAWE